jgi:hypothetical protein
MFQQTGDPYMDDKDLDVDPSLTSDQNGDTGIQDMDPVVEADSPAAKGEDRASLLGVIRDVVSKRETAATETDEPEPDSPSKSENSDQEPEGETEPDDENFSDVPFHKHKRFQQLLRKTKEFEADATAHRNVTQYLAENGLSAQEAAQGIELMALAKAEPKRALEILRPLVQGLLVQTGEILPPDLQAKVAAGALTRDIAIEMSKLRAEQQFANSRAEREAQRSTEVYREAAVREMGQAATEWALGRRQKDPNFATKERAIAREVVFLQRTDGFPRNAQEVRRQLEKAYEAVNAEFKPKTKPAKAPLTGGSASPQSGAKPTDAPSTMEIIRSKLAERA